MTYVSELKEVHFHSYCPSCRHYEKKEEQEPCRTCLDEPVNTNSHKPVKYEEKRD